MHLNNGPEQPYTKQVAKHKKNAAIGEKTTTYSNHLLLDGVDARGLSVDEEVTLMEWGNCIIRSVSPLRADLHLEGDFKKTKKKLTWLAESATTPVTLVDYDYLITERKVEEDMNFEDILNPETEYRRDAIADLNVKEPKRGAIIQFERQGYFILDSENPQVFVEIPDGRLDSVSLKGAARKAQDAKEEQLRLEAEALKAAKKEAKAKAAEKKKLAKAAKADAQS